jgi:uncharacterized protein (UPF0332 family)
MKPESTTFLEQAHVMLGRAERMLAADLYEDAARCAYLACFHVAQALIFERIEEVFKTHKGVQGEFNRLVKNDTRSDHELRKFFSRGYEFKALADYGVGPDAVISASAAAEAVATAKQFVAHFAGLVAVTATQRPDPAARP